MELEITFGLIAKLASADGAVSTTEIKVVEKLIDEVLKLDLKQKNSAIEAFNKAKKSENSFSDYAIKYREIMNSKPEMLAWMLDILVKLSYADKHISDNEVELLNQASSIFGVALTKYEKFFNKKNIDKELIVLGCSSTDTLEQISLKYDQLCKDYNPEKIAKLSLPQEFIDLAEAKIAEFSKAFSEIKKQSGS